MRTFLYYIDKIKKHINEIFLVLYRVIWYNKIYVDYRSMYYKGNADLYVSVFRQHLSDGASGVLQNNETSTAL